MIPTSTAYTKTETDKPSRASYSPEYYNVASIAKQGNLPIKDRQNKFTITWQRGNTA